MPTLKQLTKKHPTYIANIERWTILEKLVAGGLKVDMAVRKELLQNPDSRPQKIIEARSKNSTYVNILGSTENRIVAQLFQEPANFEGSDDEFWTNWLDSTAFILDADDDAKAGFTLGLKEAAMMALTNGKAIAEISTRFSGEAQNLKQQREMGELDPYIVLLPQSAMWDWDTDSRGFKYAKICRYRLERSGWTADDIPVYGFTIYERSPQGKIVVSQYEIRPNPENESYKIPANFKLDTAKQEDVIISVVQAGGVSYENVEVFNLNGVFDFPIKTLTLPSTLCVGDQLFDLCKEYFNIRAGIDWKFQSVLFSMPVLTLPPNSEDSDDVLAKGQKFGDGYMLVIPNGANISSLDMGGGGIPTAISFLEKINTDILNQLQQMATSAAASASGLGRSADKTREDKKPEVIMLEVIGMYIRMFADQLLDCCAIARGENIDWNVDGFNNYLGEGVNEMLTDIEQMLKNAINGPSLRKASMAKAATAFGKKYGFDVDTQSAIATEIEALPDETLNKPMALPFPPTPPQEQQNGDGQSFGADIQP